MAIRKKKLKTSYFPPENGEHVDFEWIGESQKIQRVMHYNACKIGGIKIAVGDVITVAQENDANAVGTVLELYESAGNDPHRAKVRWFFAYNEIPKRHQIALKNVHKMERFESFDDFYIGCIEDIDAETINSKCHLIVTDDEEIPVNLSASIYFIRYGFGQYEGLRLAKNQESPAEAGSSRKSQVLKTPSHSKKKPSTTVKSAPPKASHKRVKNMPVDPLTLNAASPKRKGSESVYKETSVPSVKLTKVSARAIFNSKQAFDKLMDSDDEDLGNISEPESIASSASSNSKQNETTKNKENILNPSVTQTESPKKKMQSNCIKDETSSLASNSSLTKRPVLKSPATDLKLYPLRSKPNSGNNTRRTVDRRRTIATTTQFTAVSQKNTPKLSKKVSRTGSGSKPSGKKSNTSKKNKVISIEDELKGNSSEKCSSDDVFQSPPINKRIAVNKKSSKTSLSVSRVDAVTQDSSEENDEDSSEEEDYVSSASEDNDSDNEFKRDTKVKTRRKSICMPQSSRRKSTKSVMTPGISERRKPRLKPKSPLEYARQRLHVSTVPDSLPCREEEFEDIYMFVLARLQESTGGCMYISGVPGTGKTATVHQVISKLEAAVDGYTIPHFKFVELNGMKLTDPNQAYCTILKLLTGQKATADHAAALLEKKFSLPAPRKENIIILVDELDLLWTRKQKVMYNLFEWPTRRYSKLVILAVANTMDLPERIMINRVSSRLGLTRMTFQPYTFKQLQEIVLSRIQGIEAFEEDALQLVARKVAAVSGDARRCLDICRRAVEIAETSSAVKSPRKKMKRIVGMKHVETALKEMFSSPKIQALQSLSVMETMFMKAVISEFRRTGLEEALFVDVYDQFRSHCRMEGGFEPPNASDAFRICNTLGSCRLLLVEAGVKDIHQRVRMNVNSDDVMFAFKGKSR